LAAGFAAALLIAIIGELSRYQLPLTQARGPGESSGQTATVNLALSVFAVAYAGGLMGFLVLLRLLNGPPWGNDGRWGMVALLSLVVTVKMSDIGQYTVGRLIGRRKLAPAISPGKTWEGVLGGAAFAIVASWLVFYWAARFAPASNIAAPVGSIAAGGKVAIVVFAIAVAAAGLLGDLAESMLKRDAGMKDSSTWMPGFGGVLDLLDSLLGAAPVAYLLWVTRFVGP
jgi:phosphatidate cytidylyltransferase